MKDSRNSSMDILKGIGTILVIIGHLYYPFISADGLSKWIYSFHMPLFFFVSGYLMFGKKQKTFKENLFYLLKKVLIPYYILIIFSVLVNGLLFSYLDYHTFFAYGFSFTGLLKAFTFGSEYLIPLYIQNFQLWYLLLYFISANVFYFMIKNEKSRKFLPLCLFLLIVITVPFQNLIPGRPIFHINILPAALVFLGFGYLFHQYENKLKISKWLYVIFALVGAFIAFKYPGNISVIGSVFYFLGALLTILFFYFISSESNNTILKYIGKNALFIYGIDALVMISYRFTGIEPHLSNYMQGIMLLIAQTAYIVIVSVLICYLFKKIFSLFKERVKFKKIEVPDVKLTSKILFASCLYFLLFLALNVIITSILFIFKISVSGFAFIASVILGSIYFAYILKKYKVDIKLILLIVSIGILTIFTCVDISNKLYDITGDGNAYHKVAIGELKFGWNPVYQSIDEFNNSLDNPLELKDTSSIYTDHYAKGYWIYAANTYSFSNNIESGKSIVLISALALFLLAFSFLLTKLKWVYSFIISILLTLSPVVLTQVITYYNDCLVYIFTIMLILCFTIICNKSDDHNENKNLKYLLYIILLVIMINIKFTGFVYAGLYSAVYYLFIILNKNTMKEKLKYITISSIIALIFGVLVVGLSTYPKNYLDHNAPFYPLIGGMNTVDIMTSNQPTIFENMDRFQKFFIANFSRSENISKYDGKEPSLKIPFSVSQTELNNFADTPDLRMGGYGVLFGGILVISIIIILSGSKIIYRKNRKFPWLLFLPIIGTVLIIILISEAWWARYLPQLFILPFISIFLLLYYFKGKLQNLLAVLMLALLAINSYYIYKYNVVPGLEKNAVVQVQANDIAASLSSGAKSYVLPRMGIYYFYGSVYNIYDMSKNIQVISDDELYKDNKDYNKVVFHSMTEVYIYNPLSSK